MSKTKTDAPKSDTITATCKLSQDEYDVLAKLAEKYCRTTSGHLRWLVLKAKGDDDALADLVGVSHDNPFERTRRPASVGIEHDDEEGNRG